MSLGYPTRRTHHIWTRRAALSPDSDQLYATSGRGRLLRHDESVVRGMSIASDRTTQPWAHCDVSEPCAYRTCWIDLRGKRNPGGETARAEHGTRRGGLLAGAAGGPGIRARPDAQPDQRFARWRGSRRRHELERPLLERGVLEGALHLIGADRVPAPIIEVLGDRVERDPFAPCAVPGGIARLAAAAEDREDVLDRARGWPSPGRRCPRRSPIGDGVRDARAPPR